MKRLQWTARKTAQTFVKLISEWTARVPQVCFSVPFFLQVCTSMIKHNTLREERIGRCFSLVYLQFRSISGFVAPFYTAVFVIRKCLHRNSDLPFGKSPESSRASTTQNTDTKTRELTTLSKVFAETNHFCRNKGKNKTHAIEEKIQKTSSKAL